MQNRITKLFDIHFPIIQAGMVWVSGWKLVSAVSNAGGLGLIGAGSMKPELLHEHIIKCKAATENPFGVNIPLLRGDVKDLINVILEEDIKIVFSSAGHPGRHIDDFKKNNIKVVHVVSNVKQAIKAMEAGCDAVVGEGVEAGGHNGADELTTFCLIPQLVDALDIPVIAAGGITDGRGIIAAMALGAEGVQIGTRFAVTKESSANEFYKQKIIEAGDTSTTLVLKKIGMARMIKNGFSEEISKLEMEGASTEVLKEKLGTKREMKGIFEGNYEEGMMEAGQGSGLIKDIPSVSELMKRLVAEYDNAKKNVG
ncbi:MAG: nitronate monooxygenase [Ignavibacteriae bacterium HGW-Ignavibacteriae-2]|nr:MAG: nitronate monooxygenase [Ignavibacteriae bacterium HGW-Ignavibacteriae-2]